MRVDVDYVVFSRMSFYQFPQKVEVVGQKSVSQVSGYIGNIGFIEPIGDFK